ncbi:MAG: serine hydrolase [Pyrinomonadaceae bacterium]|nr:serine hydrolase [Pyrinomonadaceae bacterium]
MVTRSPHIYRLVLAITLSSLHVFAQTNDSPKVRLSFKLPPNFAEKTAKYMQERVRVTGFSGAVLVAHDGRPVFREGYGLANHELSVTNTPKTRFRLGSVTKQFTAAAILLLEERGKLKVADPVNKYLSDWPKAWNKVTIHHLLSHTGGLPRLTTQVLLDVSGLSRGTPLPFRSIRDLYKPGEELQQLDFKSGEKFAYNNQGYIVLGLLIEKVSGKPYCEFMREQIFRPSGMTDTDCEEPRVVLKQRASGYTGVDGTIANAGYIDMRFPGGAGAILSTVDDLLLWDRVLASDRLLSAGARDKLFTIVKSDYAYGWWVQTKFKRKVEWHRGTVSGFMAMIARYPEEKLFIAVLSNFERTQVRAIATELAAIALGEEYELPREHKEIKIEPETYDAYVGKYSKDGKPDDSFALVRDGSKLMMQIPPGQTVFEIFPESPVEFFSKGTEYYLTFAKNDEGKVTHVLIRNEGEESRWIKSP